MEVGSEFAAYSIMLGNNTFVSLANYEKRYILSGRTGLSLICDEEKQKHSLSSIALPAYCCGSMIAPFASKGIDVMFYGEDSDSIHRAIDRADSVLVMDYFGFVRRKATDIAKMVKQEGKSLIVDATQTAFSIADTYAYADYIVVSYRKWFDALAAVVYCKAGFLSCEYSKIALDYQKTWRKAAGLKKAYLTTSQHDRSPSVKEKSMFLPLYSSANHMLDKDYCGYAASAEEIERIHQLDSTSVTQKRRDNAGYLMSEITRYIDEHQNCGIELMFSSLEAKDCPLFVPVLLPEEKRDVVRQRMINAKIYCPIHWPVNRTYPFQETTLHRTELSMVCDQRYGLDEMKKEASAFLQALNEWI